MDTSMIQMMAGIVAVIILFVIIQRRRTNVR
jgi:hypothetical protein